MKIFLKLFFTTIFLCSCASKQETASNDFGRSTYWPLVEKHTVGEKQYSGFHNIFDYKATLLTTATLDAQTRFRALYSGWGEDHLNKQASENTEKLATTTTIFLSFYTPEKKTNDLTAKSAPWTVLLETGGQRYPGEIKVNRQPQVELQALYPHHTRWSQAYSVHFKVPASLVEQGQSQLIITGPLGASTQSFQ